MDSYLNRAEQIRKRVGIPATDKVQLNAQKQEIIAH